MVRQNEIESDYWRLSHWRTLPLLIYPNIKFNLESKFVVCINNQDYQASLEVRKIYRIIPDNRATEHQFIRVIDESGEDYLYPVAYFVPI